MLSFAYKLPPWLLPGFSINFFNLWHCTCVCAVGMPIAQGGQKMVSAPQKLELQMVVSFHVGAGHQIQALRRAVRLVGAEPSPQLFLFFPAYR